MKDFFVTRIKPGLKILDQPWFYPIMLLLVGLAAYGIIFTHPGFYWMIGNGLSLQLHSCAPVRILYRAARYLLCQYHYVSLLKMTPAAWQFGSLILAGCGNFIIYFTLNAIGPPIPG